jgi:hypothetical protein
MQEDKRLVIFGMVLEPWPYQIPLDKPTQSIIEIEIFVNSINI